MRDMNESDLLDTLITDTKRRMSLCHLLGWRATHARPARVIRGNREIYETAFSADGKGFPDIFAVRPPRMLWAELKSDGEYPRPEQAAWLDLLAECELAEVYLWRPADLEEITEILTMSHIPNLIERAELATLWVNRREA